MNLKNKKFPDIFPVLREFAQKVGTSDNEGFICRPGLSEAKSRG
jgi:hypothetical protein